MVACPALPSYFSLKFNNLHLLLIIIIKWDSGMIPVPIKNILNPKSRLVCFCHEIFEIYCCVFSELSGGLCNSTCINVYPLRSAACSKLDFAVELFIYIYKKTALLKATLYIFQFDIHYAKRSDSWAACIPRLIPHRIL